MGTDVQFVAATLEHAAVLARTMRAEDVAEVLAADGSTPLVAIERSLEASNQATTCLFDGKVAFMFGVSVLRRESLLGAPTLGVVWNLTSEEVNRRPKTFWRWTKPVIRTLLGYCPRLVNAIDARHGPALRWAARAGAEFGNPVPQGPYGLLFVPFLFRRQ